MPTVIKGQPTSKEIIEKLAALDEPVLLAFSCGKDSIATWIALEEAGIDVIPAYMWNVPHLKFIDEQIEYFEGVFNKKINRYPHPSFYRFLAAGVMQAPERLRILEAVGIGTPSYDDLWKVIREDLGLPASTWVADGVRAADSIVRRASFVKHGVMKEKSRKVSPIADWLKAEVMEAIENRGIKLPIDYELFGRSFDGIDRRFTAPLKEHLPDDYNTLLAWHPLIECDVLRGEMDV